ncbi:DNA polymerase delta, subunit 4-domain-containing protein [Hypoxylon cercidicola]|nr:DNA polymerase delta, subunit 4-domain-containing protein [Hypoxylon cercidicola]
MPTTRRSSGNAARRANGRQATLSFNHRVTKPAPKSTKDLVSSKPATQSPLAKHVSSAQPESADEEERVKKEEEDAEEAKVKVEEEPKFQAGPEPESEVKSEAELRAEDISGRQIDQYWKKLERERKAKRVHQEDLTQAEKVLRYWDVSSQYGPCVGISRMKRWKRAEKLGLNPPLEVLAVLLKEESEGVEMAHMDDILNSTAIGAA